MSGAVQLILSSLALILGAAVTGWLALKGKNREVKVTAEQGMIDRLSRENINQRDRLAAMDVQIDRLRAKIDAQDEKIEQLEDELRQTRADLAEEREARKTGQAAGKLREAKAIERITANYAGGADLPEVPEETP